MREHLILFARSPFSPGVKTRLARGLGGSAARGIYARLLYQTLFRLLEGRQPDVKITLSLADGKGLPFFKEAFPELRVAHQCAGSLGVRMHAALKEAFDDGAEKSVLIGSDLPEMHYPLIRKAFDQIDPTTIVLGPAEDGGFYLIGLPAFPGSEIFDGIPWSTPNVLSRLVENIQQSGYQSSLLATQRDIDHAADWHAWQARMQQHR
jgi:hypothetical protein